MAINESQKSIFNKHLPSLGITPSDNFVADVNQGLAIIVNIMNGGREDADKIKFDPEQGYTETLGRDLLKAITSQKFTTNIRELKSLNRVSSAGAKRILSTEEYAYLPKAMREDPDALLAFAGDARNLLVALNDLNRSGDLTLKTATASSSDVKAENSSNKDPVSMGPDYDYGGTNSPTLVSATDSADEQDYLVSVERAEDILTLVHSLQNPLTKSPLVPGMKTPGEVGGDFDDASRDALGSYMVFLKNYLTQKGVFKGEINGNYTAGEQGTSAQLHKALAALDNRDQEALFTALGGGSIENGVRFTEILFASLNIIAAKEPDATIVPKSPIAPLIPAKTTPAPDTADKPEPKATDENPELTEAMKGVEGLLLLMYQQKDGKGGQLIAGMPEPGPEDGNLDAKDQEALFVVLKEFKSQLAAAKKYDGPIDGTYKLEQDEKTGALLKQGVESLPVNAKEDLYKSFGNGKADDGKIIFDDIIAKLDTLAEHGKINNVRGAEVVEASEDKVRSASVVVEKALGKFAQGIKQTGVKLADIKAPTEDGKLDAQELDTLYTGLAFLKKTLGIRQPNGDYTKEIGSQLRKAIEDPEKEKALKTLGINKEELAALLDNLDVLNEENVINHARAQKANIASVGLGFARDLFGDGAVDGVLGFIANIVTQFPMIGELVNMFMKGLFGIGLEDLLSDQWDEKGLARVDFSGDAQAVNEQIASIYQKALDNSGGDPAKLKTDVLSTVDKINGYRLFTSNDDKQALHDIVSQTLDDANGDKLKFAQTVQAKIAEYKAQKENELREQNPATRDQDNTVTSAQPPPAGQGTDPRSSPRVSSTSVAGASATPAVLKTGASTVSASPGASAPQGKANYDFTFDFSQITNLPKVTDTSANDAQQAYVDTMGDSRLEHHKWGVFYAEDKAYAVHHNGQEIVAYDITSKLKDDNFIAFFDNVAILDGSHPEHILVYNAYLEERKAELAQNGAPKSGPHLFNDFRSNSGASNILPVVADPAPFHPIGQEPGAFLKTLPTLNDSHLGILKANGVDIKSLHDDMRAKYDAQGRGLKPGRILYTGLGEKDQRDMPFLNGQVIISREVNGKLVHSVAHRTQIESITGNLQTEQGKINLQYHMGSPIVDSRAVTAPLGQGRRGTKYGGGNDIQVIPALTAIDKLPWDAHTVRSNAIDLVNRRAMVDRITDAFRQQTGNVIDHSTGKTLSRRQQLEKFNDLAMGGTSHNAKEAQFRREGYALTNDDRAMRQTRDYSGANPENGRALTGQFFDSVKGFFGNIGYGTTLKLAEGPPGDSPPGFHTNPNHITMNDDLH